MEAAGDSPLVNKLQSDKQETVDQDIVEFERNLDEFKKSLDSEEDRLNELEEQRLKLQADIEEMLREIKDEKAEYRRAIDKVMEERENILDQLGAQESSLKCNALSPIASSMSLFEACKNAIEDGKKQDYEIDIDIEKIRCDLMDSYISTKEDYLSTMKEHLQQKKKKLEQHATNESM